MKRPIFITAIGFIIGIIWGLYFNIVLFIFFLLGVLVLLNSNKIKLVKILKIFITKNVIILFCISFICAFCYIKYLENDYEKIYNSLNKVECIGTIIEEKMEKKYNYTYKVKLEKINNKKAYGKKIYINIPKNINVIKYGNKILFNGEYIKPDTQRNHNGFDYSRYLKTQGIYGTIKVNSGVKILKEKNIDFLHRISNSIRNKIICNTNKVFPKNTKDVFMGLLVGYDEFINEEVKEDFTRSSLSHLLAVSGTHISYILIGIGTFFKLLNMNKKLIKICTCIFLIFYLFLINFTPSVTRAVIMGIILALQMVINRKQDTLNSISFSSLLILISNPYNILNVGFILSYAGTISIIIFMNSSKKKLNNYKEKIINSIKNIIKVTLSAQILIFPITVYFYNSISLTFMISNLIAGIIIGPIVLIGMILILLSFINIKLTFYIVKIYNFLLLILIKSTGIIGKIPLSNIYVKTPKVFLIITYYMAVFIIFILVLIKKSKRVYLNKKINFLISKIKNIIKINLLKNFYLILLISIIYFILNQIPKDFKINFIDVGQGDSCMITTPMGKTILIDGGGNDNYDVGKKVLFPYILDRRITKIDYIIISHFDTDHCKGLESIEKNLKIKNVIISKQVEKSENYQQFLKIANKRKINIIYVNMGDIINIEKNVNINILWPNNNSLIKENALNNNSIVCRIDYKRFSCLFTGDIEKIAEDEMVKKYGNSNVLKSTVLKVAHHGSKTSSTEEFIKKVNPKIALIGVGENNKFGHPNDETIKKLNSIRC